MRRLPPDVERLMWLVAEEGDPRAVEEFEQRFPDLKADLHRRMSMIRGLKGAKRGTAIPSSIPRFRPTEPSRGAAGTHRMAWTLGGLALAALALASYSLTSSLVRPAEPPRKQPPAQRSAVNPPERHDPVVGDGTLQAKPVNPPQPEHGGSVATVDPTPGYLKPINLKMNAVELKLVLQAIELKSGMKLAIGPGIENPVIDADYQNMSAMEILQDLGTKYGFVPFDQGNGEINVVPTPNSGIPSNEARSPKDPRDGL